MSGYVSAELRRLLRDRALGRCEYCLIHEDSCYSAHEPDHIIALKHGGETVLENLAFACAVCNGLKGSDIASMDWESQQIVRLFHPRLDTWSDHFRLENGLLLPRTSIGRATGIMLRFNEQSQLNLRRFLIRLSEYP
jgi:hypothetical protein